MYSEKIVLVNESQGERGEEGRKKKYIILCSGSRVSFYWGRAEKPEWTYQVKSVTFDTEERAKNYATEQMYKKMDKGYQKASY